MSASNYKILVVEDEFQVRTLFVKLLLQEGYQVLSASNAQDALEILASEKVDLILLDLRMPGPTDGEDLLYALRDRGDDVLIIVVSAWIDFDLLIDQPDCVFAVLEKPVQFHKLLETVCPSPDRINGPN